MVEAIASNPLAVRYLPVTWHIVKVQALRELRKAIYATLVLPTYQGPLTRGKNIGNHWLMPHEEFGCPYPPRDSDSGRAKMQWDHMHKTSGGCDDYISLTLPKVQVVAFNV